MKDIEIRKYELPKIEIKDYEEIKRLAEEDTEKYKKYIVTEDTLDSDIKKRAELREIAKEIDTRRKEIEKDISIPIKKFKEDCDYLKKLYEDSADLIDTQVKAFEEKQKNEKKAKCEEIYNQVIGEFKEQLPFEKIFNPKWLNKTTKESEIQKEIEAKVNNTRVALETIKSLKSEFELELVNTYFETMDINQAITKNNQLLEQKEKLQEVAKRQEEIKEEKIEKMLTEEVKEEEIDPIKTYTLKITAPLSKQVALRKFLEINGMKFEKVE